MTVFDALPLYDGVGASKLYLPSDSTAQTLYEHLCATFEHIAADVWTARFLSDKVLVQVVGVGFVALAMDTPYSDVRGKHIYYYRALADEVSVPFVHQVLFEHPRFLVVDKPHFLNMTPTGNYVRETLLTRLRREYDSDELTPIHRLDRETAGLVLFCRDKRYRGAYQTLFEARSVKKVYHAIAAFNPELQMPTSLQLCMVRGEPFYTMTTMAGAPNSETDIDILARSADGAWAKYILRPSTGKLHQLRVHMNHLGLPIKNDRYYPQVCHAKQGDFSQPLQLLAKSLSFTDPISGEHYYFESAQDLAF